MSIVLKILMAMLMMMAGKAHACFAYVPFIDLVNEAEFIIQGEIINKSYKKESREGFYITRNRDGKVEKKPSINEDIYTDYQLLIQKNYKKDTNQDVITVEEIGGCDVDGDICVSNSAGYEFETGQQVLIFLKYDKKHQVYKSTNGGLTVYFMNDYGIVYNKQYADKELEKLKTVKPIPFESFDGETPFHIDQLKQVIEKVKNSHRVRH